MALLTNINTMYAHIGERLSNIAALIVLFILPEMCYVKRYAKALTNPIMTRCGVSLDGQRA